MGNRREGAGKIKNIFFADVEKVPTFAVPNEKGVARGARPGRLRRSNNNENRKARPGGGARTAEPGGEAHRVL